MQRLLLALTLYAPTLRARLCGVRGTVPRRRHVPLSRHVPQRRHVPRRRHGRALLPSTSRHGSRVLPMTWRHRGTSPPADTDPSAGRAALGRLPLMLRNLPLGRRYVAALLPCGEVRCASVPVYPCPMVREVIAVTTHLEALVRARLRHWGAAGAGPGRLRLRLQGAPARPSRCTPAHTRGAPG